LHPSWSFPVFLSPVASLGPLGNLISWRVLETLMNPLMRGLANGFREHGLNMRPIPWWRNRVREVRALTRPVCYAYSSHVLPKPSDWDKGLHVTGYCFLDTSNYTPPADLAAFLQQGPPPVYVGFGSMRSADPITTAQSVCDALRMAGLRGVLLTGWRGMQRPQLSDQEAGRVCFVDEVPHDWLFKQVAAVVHHGGAGTTAAGLRAGVPTIIIPRFGDQFFWANRVERLGVGIRHPSRARLDPRRLADSLRRAVSDPEIASRAKLLGEAIRGEDGTGRAAEVICSVAAGIDSAKAVGWRECRFRSLFCAKGSHGL
jgi:sterol 3beta-glucosyltransferase